MSEGLTMTLTGTQEMIQKVRSMVKNKREKTKLALTSVLAEMVNWIKTNHEGMGGWINRTGALEQSISYVPAFDKGDSIVGIIYAGQSYALYVEFLENHWVISGAMTAYRNQVLKLIAERVRAQG